MTWHKYKLNANAAVPFDRSLSVQPISTRTHTQENKAHEPLCTSWISQTNVSAMFNDHKILLFWLQNKQDFHMFSLLDLRFALCSCGLNECLKATRSARQKERVNTTFTTRLKNDIDWCHTCTILISLYWVCVVYLSYYKVCKGKKCCWKVAIAKLRTQLRTGGKMYRAMKRMKTRDSSSASHSESDN